MAHPLISSVEAALMSIPDMKVTRSGDSWVVKQGESAEMTIRLINPLDKLFITPTERLALKVPIPRGDFRLSRNRLSRKWVTLTEAAHHVDRTEETIRNGAKEGWIRRRFNTGINKYEYRLADAEYFVRERNHRDPRRNYR
jgi:hypothetical protein